MQAGNGTAPAPGGGAAGRPTFDQILWLALGSNAGKITSWTVLGVAMVGLLTGKIFLDTGRYYEFFHERDSRWVQIAVAIGTLAAAASFSIDVAQGWKLARHAFTDFHNIRAFEANSAYVNDLIGTHLKLAASTYYAYRAFKMSGRKIWLGVLMQVLVVVSYIMSLYVNITGLLAPDVTVDTVRELKIYNDKLGPVRRAWGAMSVTSDGLIMLVLMYYLVSARESVFHREKRVYHKLVMLTLETMLPPVICITVLVATNKQKGSPTADYRLLFRMLIPTLFWVSLLHSLVARATIRQMLGTSLASDGMLKPELSIGPNDSVFVATYGAGVSEAELGENRERDLEAGASQVTPLAFQRRDGSPISHDSDKKIKPSGI